MKKTITLKAVTLCLAGTVLLSSCASTTLIQSNPQGANLYIDGEKVGRTPYSYTDTKIVGSATMIRLEKDGYETLNTSFSRNEQADAGAIIGGLLVWVPFLWTMKYKPMHSYELSPALDQQPNVSAAATGDTQSKAERLKELKQLLDDKTITQEEFDAEKKKILEE
jgi:hypothetical protein